MSSQTTAMTSKSALEPASQWGRLGQAIGRTIDRARGATDQPSDARAQLDDAELAFNQLLAEVNSVMKTPVILPPRSGSASDKAAA
jgi:hypothetical protein